MTHTALPLASALAAALLLAKPTPAGAARQTVAQATPESTAASPATRPATSAALAGAAAARIDRDPVQHRIRGELDGSGLSDLAALGGTLLAIDPNEGLVHAYDAANIGEAGRVCRMPREFAPWRTRRSPSGALLVISEDEATTLEIGTNAPAGWQREGEGPPVVCGMPRPYSQATDAPPPFRRLGNPTGRTLLAEVPNPLDARRPARLKAGARGQILDVKPLGTLSGGRFAVLWKELDQWPVDGLPAPSSAGRVLVNVWVSVFGREGRLQDNILIQDVGLPEDGASRGFEGLHKRAFEWAAVGTAGRRDWLYLLEGRDKSQMLTRFALPSLPFRMRASQGRATATIDLHSGSLPEPSQDPTEPAGAAAPALAADADAFGPSGTDDWSKAVIARVTSFAEATWPFPAAALSRPCAPSGGDRGNDQCDVTTDEEGELVAATEAPPRLAQQDGKPARWIGPRQLVGAPGTPDQVGLPYSYGGGDSVASFRARLAAFGGPGNHPPIGNIKLTLSRRAPTLPKVDYPLGVDCSHFVAAVFGVPLLSTEEMLTGTAIGPSGAYATPVPHLSQIRTGDVMVKDGHVVIFTRTVPIGRSGLRQASLGLEVYEATSRCGRVCRSVYEPDFFNGWWIVRMPRLRLPSGEFVPNPNPDPGAATPDPARRQHS